MQKITEVQKRMPFFSIHSCKLLNDGKESLLIANIENTEEKRNLSFEYYSENEIVLSFHYEKTNLVIKKYWN